jgi:beta-phosphoglucomutase family hydrolase
MTSAFPVTTLSPQEYDAVLFDLDGVLTKTAVVHAAAWKRMFDGFLEQRSAQSGVPFVPFDPGTDYRRHVDGKPRYEGVAAFLAARGIVLPVGSPQDSPGTHSQCALGNLKDQYFHEHVTRIGVEPYAASVALVRKLRGLSIRTAVVSSSDNCAAVLEAAGIGSLFDARVDGTDLTRFNLRGKPAPDAFLEAARRLGAEPARAVVIEDAVAGVAAGHAGGFGCVIGVDRSGHALALRNAGADVVVSDLAQVDAAAQPSSEWSLLYDAFEPEREGVREALCTLGNGYFATRGAAAWVVADDVHYPGTYLACGYNRLRSEVAGRVVENEDLVNFLAMLLVPFHRGVAAAAVRCFER